MGLDEIEWFASQLKAALEEKTVAAARDAAEVAEQAEIVAVAAVLRDERIKR